MSGLQRAIILISHLDSNKRFNRRVKRLQAHPELSLSISREFLKIYSKNGCDSADQFLESTHNALFFNANKNLFLNLSWDMERLAAFSRELCDKLIETLNRLPHLLVPIYSKHREDSETEHDDEFYSAHVEICRSYIRDFGIDLTDTQALAYQNKFGNYGTFLRLTNTAFLFRRLRKLKYSQTENISRQIGMVGKWGQQYASLVATRLSALDAAASSRFMNSHYLQSNDGQQISLLEASRTSVSNPEIRLAEMAIRFRGLQKFADENSHVCDFYTKTAPSAFHARLSKTGRPNPRYNGSTVRECNDYMNRDWARIRAQLQREAINFYGLRVVEPHVDGTPHWHMLIFSDSANRNRIREIIAHHSLSDSRYADEPGAKKHRLKIVEINPKIGSALNYVSKYLQKNLGVDFKSDSVGAPSPICSWKKMSGLRQFQFFGSAPVGIWRELRRLRDLPLSDSIFERARDCAVANDFYGYQKIHSAAQFSLFSIKTEKLNCYGETIDNIFGIRSGELVEKTRFIEWTIIKIHFEIDVSTALNCNFDEILRQPVLDSSQQIDLIARYRPRTGSAAAGSALG